MKEDKKERKKYYISFSRVLVFISIPNRFTVSFSNGLNGYIDYNI